MAKSRKVTGYKTATVKTSVDVKLPKHGSTAVAKPGGGTHKGTGGNTAMTMPGAEGYSGYKGCKTSLDYKPKQ